MNERSVDLSVIIPVRNRAGVRLDNCLRSSLNKDVERTRVIQVALEGIGGNGCRGRGLS